MSRQSPEGDNPFADQDNYSSLYPSLNPFADQEDDQSRSPSPNPFARQRDDLSQLTINLQGTSDPLTAFTDMKMVMQEVVPGADCTLDGGLARIQIPDNWIIQRKSQHDLGHVTVRDDVCAITIAASGTGDQSIRGNNTVFAVA